MPGFRKVSVQSEWIGIQSIPRSFLLLTWIGLCNRFNLPRYTILIYIIIIRHNICTKKYCFRESKNKKKKIEKNNENSLFSVWGTARGLSFLHFVFISFYVRSLADTLVCVRCTVCSRTVYIVHNNRCLLFCAVWCYITYFSIVSDRIFSDAFPHCCCQFSFLM